MARIAFQTSCSLRVENWGLWFCPWGDRETKGPEGSICGVSVLAGFCFIQHVGHSSVFDSVMDVPQAGSAKHLTFQEERLAFPVLEDSWTAGWVILGQKAWWSRHSKRRIAAQLPPLSSLPLPTLLSCLSL